MSTVVVVEDEIYDENYGSWWWVFLITGTLWLILSLIMFRFNLTLGEVDRHSGRDRLPDRRRVRVRAWSRSSAAGGGRR